MQQGLVLTNYISCKHKQEDGGGGGGVGGRKVGYCVRSSEQELIKLTN